MNELPKMNRWLPITLEDAGCGMIVEGDGFFDVIQPVMEEPVEGTFSLFLKTRVMQGVQAHSLVMACPGMCGHVRCGGSLEVFLN